MSHPAIIVENLGKSYRIGLRPGSSYQTLRESLVEFVGAPLRRLRKARSARAAASTFWALRGVTFQVQPGEVVGIIGRNGAGKSTLLKLLSRITAPTEGCIRLRGRVGSLLEVGTGFHPELTGRENIYLNGSILGMSKVEIDRKFDEIVAFSGVEKFLDTQVKRYSSGMHVRLGFSVAAHLEPDILIVDEVLTVGDAAFQRRCLSKMNEVAGHGRTVLFVSHDMNAVMRLCPRAILLDQGRITADGSSAEVTQIYLHSDHGTIAERVWSDPKTAPQDHVARLRSVRIHDEDGQTTPIIDIRRPVGIEMVFEVLEGGHVLMPNHHVFNEDGVCLFVAMPSLDPEWKRHPQPPGLYSCTAWIPGNFLAEGTVVVSPALSTPDPATVHFWEKDAVAFQVADSLDGDSVRGDYAGHFPGVIRPVFRWELRRELATTTPAPVLAAGPNGSL